MPTLPAKIDAQIGPHLDGWTIDAYPATPPTHLGSGRIYLVIWRDDIKVDPASDLQVLHGLTLRLMTGSTPTPATDALLADALDELLAVLHDHAAAATWGKWTARYAIFPNADQIASFPGWEITFPSFPSPNLYRKKQR